MKRFRNILVAVDTRFDEHPIIDEAVAIAEQSGGAIKIVDVVPEFSWTVRLTLNDHEHMRDLIAEEKRTKLTELSAPLKAKGIDAESKVLMGKTSVEIIREAVRGEHDLVMRVTKGHDSRSKGFFGNTGSRLLRQCPCAVWLVTPERQQFQHVLGCVDTSTGDLIDGELNNKVFELAKTISGFHGGFYSIIQAWLTWNWQMLKSRMEPEAFTEMEAANKKQVTQQLDHFLATHGAESSPSNVHLVNGDPADVITRFARKNDVDLVIMGTVGRSGISGAVVGNTAEQVLARIECSVLALKPSNFVSPIASED
ncbi:universal stress protein [Planctomycetes bacterium K23_9]|uniref:Universal stress protein E n=1 Tax=Stieleria marina TaxID=1930275 RepID=A0A517P011_9BACT|nr:Universal stress protein E [Planctomycetes bacterium K23_9]